MGRISNPPSGYFPAFMRCGLTAQACPLRVEIHPTGIRIKHFFNGFTVSLKGELAALVVRNPPSIPPFY